MKYELVITTKNCEHIGSYTAYGVRCGSDIISDISVDRVKVECLIDRMNTYELSPIHMMDFVEDFLAEDCDFFHAM